MPNRPLRRLPLAFLQAAAQACVTIDGELAVADHRTGARFDVPGQGSVTRRAGAVLQPIGYYQGSLVSFDTLRVELWSEAGDCVLKKALDVKQPLREEPSDPVTKTNLNHQDSQEPTHELPEVKDGVPI